MIYHLSTACALQIPYVLRWTTPRCKHTKFVRFERAVAGRTVPFKFINFFLTRVLNSGNRRSLQTVALSNQSDLVTN